MRSFKHLIFSLAILLSANYAVAQTTVNLADQCNCEVFYSSTVVNAGATAPAGADEGDLLVDNEGNTFFWDGDSWEPTADNTIEPWFGTDDDAVATDNTEDIYQIANVGIGLTDPLARLDVQGTGLGLPATTGTTPSISTRTRIGNPSYVLDIGINELSGEGQIWFQSTNRNNLSDASSISLNPNGGNVGLGLSNPKKQLDVNGEARIRTLNEGAAKDSIVTANAGGVLRKRSAADISSAAEPWFGTDDDAAAIDNTEDIYQIANVGIGETNPLARLDIRGSGLGLPATSGTTPTTATRARIGNPNYILDIGINDLGDNGEIWFQSTNRNNLSVVSTILLNPNGGKVGVGLSDPDESLDVNGNIKASGNLQTGTSTYPDYVFEAYEEGSSVLNKSYTFKSLEEVESFIKINKHLPGVKSITELEKTAEGLYNVDITAASMQTLEKVEELFLYTIEQEKKIAKLEQRLAKLEALLTK